MDDQERRKIVDLLIRKFSHRVYELHHDINDRLSDGTPEHERAIYEKSALEAALEDLERRAATLPRP